MPKFKVFIEKFLTPDVMDLGLDANMREIPVLGVDENLSRRNVTYIAPADGVTSASEFFKKRVREEKVTRITKKSIRMIDIEIKHTCDNLPKGFTEEAFAKETLSFVIKEFGRANVLHFVLHRDEGDPHVHALVVPIIHSRLCYSDFIHEPAGVFKFENRLYKGHLEKLGFGPSFDFKLPSDILKETTDKDGNYHRAYTTDSTVPSCQVSFNGIMPTAKAYDGMGYMLRKEKEYNANLRKLLNCILSALQKERDKNFSLENEIRQLYYL